MNGHFPPWDEWKQLTPDQREYRQHELLHAIPELIKEVREAAFAVDTARKDQEKECSRKFQCMEDFVTERCRIINEANTVFKHEVTQAVAKKKWWDRSASAGGGFVGGAFAFLISKFSGGG